MPIDAGKYFILAVAHCVDSVQAIFDDLYVALGPHIAFTTQFDNEAGAAGWAHADHPQDCAAYVQLGGIRQLGGICQALGSDYARPTQHRESESSSEDHSDVSLLRLMADAMCQEFQRVGGHLTDPNMAVELGKRLGKQAAATTAWREFVGESLETEQVTQLLGITRQALDSRKRTGSVLALRGTGTSYYPRWQFKIDDTTATVRPIILGIVAAFREEDANMNPYTIAAWAMSPQPELDGQTPATWIEADGADDPVLLAAKRTAVSEVM